MPAAGNGAPRARSGVPVGAPPAPLLSVEDLSVSFSTEHGRVPVVENVSFAIAPGQTVGLVGESGCGKSVTAMSVMRLLPSPPSHVDGGRVVFDGHDLLALDRRAMRAVRGNHIGMIFQEPMTSLNPTLSVGFQVSEVLRLHHRIKAREARERSIEILAQVGIGAAEQRIDQYPHELSGGLRQRVMIALALVCHPALLIADEPTTALDVTIQAQILDLLGKLQRDLGMAMLMITHDLGVAGESCDSVVVMYAGQVVECASARALFAVPRHPYTRALLEARPHPSRRGRMLPSIPGMVPAPGQRAPGCPFVERCASALAQCREQRPVLEPLGGRRALACWNPGA